MLVFLKEHARWLTLFSLLFMLGSLLGAGIFIVRVSPDFFLRHAPGAKASSRSLPQLVRFALRNLAGVALAIIGILLSLPLVPGPGVLLIVIGVSLADFPGKRRFKAWFMHRRFTLGPANWLRARFGRPRLLIPPARPRSRA